MFIKIFVIAIVFTIILWRSSSTYRKEIKKDNNYDKED